MARREASQLARESGVLRINAQKLGGVGSVVGVILKRIRAEFSRRLPPGIRAATREHFAHWVMNEIDCEGGRSRLLSPTASCNSVRAAKANGSRRGILECNSVGLCGLAYQRRNQGSAGKRILARLRRNRAQRRRRRDWSCIGEVLLAFDAVATTKAVVLDLSGCRRIKSTNQPARFEQRKTANRRNYLKADVLAAGSYFER